MDEENLLALKLDEDSMTANIDTEMVPLQQTKMEVVKPIVVLGIEDGVGYLKESVMVFRDEEENENEIEEVRIEQDPDEDDENSKDEVSIDEDPEEEAKNCENPKEEVSIEEDLEEEAMNDENPKEEVSIEEDQEEELKNDENPEEEVKNEAKNEGRLEAISKNKASKLRKRPKVLKKKKTASRKKVRNVLAPTSELDKDGWIATVDTKMAPSNLVKLHGEESIISFPMLDTNDISNDVEPVVVTSRKNGIVHDVDTEVAKSKPVKLNGEESHVVLGVKDKLKRPKESIMRFGDEEEKEHEIGEANNEENTKEEQNEGDTIKEAKAKEKLKTNSKKKIKKFRNMGKTKKKVLRDKKEMVVKNREHPEYSKKTATMKDKSTGTIFMCSSKTKKDCYRYQVLGLPASKRDIVFEIYEGMKLFLFDYDLKLMYGIYEAAGPGGYNIEPKAFDSAFPSQVRFNVLEDCLPLAEEKFKRIIKDNYYSKNKFDCQLNSIQVKNLCSLFSRASKGATSKQLHRSEQAEAPIFVDHEPRWTHRSGKAESPQVEAPTFVDSKCKRPRKNRKAESTRPEAPTFVGRRSKLPGRSRKAESQQLKAPTLVGGKPKRPQQSRKADSGVFVDPRTKRLRRSPRAETKEFLYRDSRHREWKDKRHRVFLRDHLNSDDPLPVTYRRNMYESPAQHPSLHQPLPRPSSDRDVYRRDNQRPLDVELICQDKFVHDDFHTIPRRGDEFAHHDSHTIPPYRDDFNHHDSYIASRGRSSYHNPSFTAGHQLEYYPFASSRRPASKYHLSAGPPPDYRHHQPVYRRY